MIDDIPYDINESVAVLPSESNLMSAGACWKSGAPCSSHRSWLHGLLAEMLSFIKKMFTFWKQIKGVN